MTAHTAPITRFDAAICGCCARSATGIGYSPNANWAKYPPIFVCDDPECLAMARSTYSIPQDRFSRIESLAAGQGGEDAGAFADSIGVTDLAAMTPDQWHEFCRRLVAGYRKALVSDLRNEAPF